MKSLTENVKIAVIGGDDRQIYTAMEIAERGYETSIYGFDKYENDVGLCTKCSCLSDAICNSRAIILPNPVSNDSQNLFLPLSEKRILIDEVFEYYCKDKAWLGGRVGNLKGEHKNKLIDYFDREELVIANAYLTAESAIAIAMGEMRVSLKDINVLVVGYGRIGKCLCNLLKGMGANVFASARRNSDFAWIRAYGYTPIETGSISKVVSSCKLIFNTVPDLVMCEDTISCISSDSIIIDLASKPGGVDFDSAAKYGIKTIWALALPGKKLPISAGRVQAKTILDLLEDEEVI